jgi:hypothetical protein
LKSTRSGEIAAAIHRAFGHTGSTTEQFLQKRLATTGGICEIFAKAMGFAFPKGKTA